jgi:hypothetical protein
MANRGKELQMGSGSRSRSQAKAEDTARRSRKRAGERRAMRTEAAAVIDGEPRTECDGCRGDGVWHGRGYVENGKFIGQTGTCFRCGGKGYQSEADVRRNRYYDDRVRRIRP